MILPLSLELLGHIRHLDPSKILLFHMVLQLFLNLAKRHTYESDGKGNRKCLIFLLKFNDFVVAIGALRALPAPSTLQNHKIPLYFAAFPESSGSTNSGVKILGKSKMFPFAFEFQ